MTEILASIVAQDRMFGNVIDGKVEACGSGETIDVVCPSDGKTFATIPASDSGDIDRAIVAARNAFNEGEWSRLTAVDRGRLLLRTG